jgi:hypothetical protein
VTVSVAVVCEGEADQRTGCDLADRVLCAEVDWIEKAVLGVYRTWRGLEPANPFLTWKEGFCTSGQGTPHPTSARPFQWWAR